MSRQNFVTLFEKYDLDNAVLVQSSGVLPRNVRKSLFAYLACDPSSSQVKVTYQRHLSGISRFHNEVEGGLKLNYTNMQTEVRAALAHKIYHDLDFCNCHPTILVQECAKLGIVHNRLQHFVENRGELLQQLMDICRVDKETAKNLPVRFMFLGTIASWCKENEIDPSWVPDMWWELEGELTCIARAVIAVYPQYTEHAIEQREKKEAEQVTKNLTGSALSYFLFTKERECMETLYRAVVDSGYVVGAFIHDGCFVEKKGGGEVLSAALLKQWQDVVENAAGYQLQLAVKPMSMSPLYSKIAAIKGDETLHTLRDGTPRDYATTKAIFERILFKVGDSATFLETPVGRGEIYRSKTNLKDAYENLYYSSIEKDKKTQQKTTVLKPFIPIWLKDEDIRTYENIDFAPPPLNVPATTYNLWKGFPIDQADVDSSANVAPFLQHLSILTSHNEKETLYLMWVLAQMVQQPGKLIGIMVVLVSKEGAGKGSLLQLLKRIVGDRHFFETSDPENRLFGRFCEGRKNRLVVNIDEAKRGDMLKYWDVLKNFITSADFQYEPKGQAQMTLRNTNRFFITTNHDLPGPGGRRVFAVNCDPSFVGKREHWDAYYAYISDDKNIKAIMEYLRAMDISKVNWIEDKPRTALYKLMVGCHANKVDLFLCYLLGTELAYKNPCMIRGEEFGYMFDSFCKTQLKWTPNKVEWSQLAPHHLTVTVAPASKGSVERNMVKGRVQYTFKAEPLQKYLVKTGLEDWIEYFTTCGGCMTMTSEPDLETEFS